MFKHVNENVYFGNWTSPLEVPANCIINVAHCFSERRGRNRYYANMEQVPWRTLQFRHAKKDGDEVTDEYMEVLCQMADMAVKLGKLPILCHCQMGGHRGPTSSIVVAWHLQGRKGLEEIHSRVLELAPGLNKMRERGRAYYRTSMEWCRRKESG